MSLQISLKLKLVKQTKIIKVKYNTFIKSTFDEFLMASLALRTKENHDQDDKVAQYLDDITGNSDLNKHFKNIYSRISKFKKEDLNRIINSSLIPTLKIDETNRYVYYPQLDVSLFRGKLYEGDLEKYESLQQLINIKEEIIEMSVSGTKAKDVEEQYTVYIDNQNNIKILMCGKFIDMDSAIFEKTLCLDIKNLDLYKGVIHDKADGEGWHIITSSTINNLTSGYKYYYKNGDHYFIRNDSVRKTTISKIYGLYIYKEEILNYANNRELCEEVLAFLQENNLIHKEKPQSLLSLIKNADNKSAQKILNDLSVDGIADEFVRLGMSLLEKGLINGWRDDVLKCFLKEANNMQLQLIYKANPNLPYKIEQLCKINKSQLSDKHIEEVEKYNIDLQEKKDTIRRIVGEITTSGLRERAKKLESDDITKKFSKLCNRLIGHETKDLAKAGLNEVNQWLEDALKLQDLAQEIKLRLDNNK